MLLSKLAQCFVATFEHGVWQLKITHGLVKSMWHLVNCVYDDEPLGYRLSGTVQRVYPGYDADAVKRREALAQHVAQAAADKQLAEKQLAEMQMVEQATDAAREAQRIRGDRPTVDRCVIG